MNTIVRYYKKNAGHFEYVEYDHKSKKFHVGNTGMHRGFWKSYDSIDIQVSTKNELNYVIDQLVARGFEEIKLNGGSQND